MNKKYLILAILVITQLAFARKTIIKMATLAPEGTDWHGMLLEMGQEWKKATNGRVRLRLYPGGVVGDERDMVRKMRIGQIHSAAISTEGLYEINPNFAAFYVPMLFQDLDDIEYVTEKLNTELYQGTNEKGFQLLYLVDVGWAYWFGKKPIYTPSDLKTHKLFTWAGDYAWAEVWRKAGYNPVPLAMTDLLSGLQTGLIDALSTIPLYALAQQSFGITNHMLDMKWGILMAGIVVDNKTWSRISKKDQKAMQIIVNTIRDKHIEKNRDAAQEALNVMQEHGLEIHKPTEMQVQSWKNEVESMYPLLRGQAIEENIFDKVIQIMKEKP
ncbi:MAG: TRAP transporter substrate-binding protein DctP [Candidatus Marinimicrobia bacterium]|jgi:TRAP-type C4-dicarboxylate transport system substrate-binding protein|nr:TRAP transporter substrate-binding protein DctP [Candidatus Neomarinimicrobiota bacterium]MBT3496125.1 TRAP transporter substrate-binding protein DctP [Candidatus Neomarinimicrobiota bacterium]MBT3692088.1 TRAP transporter substrate-binding protein DctP [Candidatus Neomarinimicrobiota bacterium]MBT3732629.1 TRAP transporter substrate-binding protein DctP [Candidatus Neomarinimicrobiota bacterium]MBT4144787.1 TRAP transporter substrate-binding protein DctP [Candidatus Neomarinimicrobiota bact